jgi:hypothetical protein
MGSIKVGPAGPKGSAAGIGVSVSGLGPSALTGTIVFGVSGIAPISGVQQGIGPISGVQQGIGPIPGVQQGIGPTGPSGGPTGMTGPNGGNGHTSPFNGTTGAGITRLMVDTSLSVDTIVLRGDRTAEFFVPSLGEKVLSFLVTPERLEEKIGDFEQGFRVLATRQGLSHAYRWYYGQLVILAVRLIWSLILDLLKPGG